MPSFLMPDMSKMLNVDSSRMLIPHFRGRIYDYQDGFAWIMRELARRRMRQSQRALTMMWEAHLGQTRADGQPYAVHPMRMAERALKSGDGNITDEVVAVILLHDVAEEEVLPLTQIEQDFSDKVSFGVERMTIVPQEGETKLERRERTFKEMLFSKEATIARAYDRQDNLSTMVAGFTDENKIRKNVVETDRLLLPSLARARDATWPEAGNLLWALIDNIRMLNDNLALVYQVRLTDESFVTGLNAEDYSYLLE